MSGFLFDSNVLLDTITRDPMWRAWSKAQLATANEQQLALINPIIYAENCSRVSPRNGPWINGSTRVDFYRLPLPYEAGWRAGQAFAQYRRAGGTRPAPLPDFYIGAHAEGRRSDAGGRVILQGTPPIFPTVKLITP